VRVHRVYFRGGQYTDQVAASASAARLYAERLFPELGASVRTECMMLVVDGRRTHVDSKLNRSFLLLVGPRVHGGTVSITSGRGMRFSPSTIQREGLSANRGLPFAWKNCGSSST
jgi:hypothetical protein